MDLGNALETAGKLCAALGAEVENAREERKLLRTLDAAALFARAAQRNAFLCDVARLERELVAELERALGGQGAVTLARVRERAPEQGEALADLVARVRALAGELQRADHLNAQLLARALACVRGYVDALRPAPSAYDRRGARALTAPGQSTVSSKG